MEVKNTVQAIGLCRCHAGKIPGHHLSALRQQGILALAQATPRVAVRAAPSYRPFRCRACLKRYIVAKPWAWTAIVGVVAFAVGIGLLAHFGKLTLPDSLSVTAAPAPVPPPAPKVEAPPPPPPVPQTPDSLLFRLNLNVPPSGNAKAK